ncbi:MAG: sigma-54-dependent Fis family transcriptional regulator [Burkholderiales bacterium]|nr:sigma-54-dependent Fis family transcriptional regulator [Burkholderiales bacterium]
MEEVDVHQHLADISNLVNGRPPVSAVDGERADWLKRCWVRSVQTHKLDPARASRRHVHTAAEVRDAAARIDVLRHIAQPHVAELHRRVRVANYCVVMTDADGLTLDLQVHGEFDAILKGAGVRVGTVWSEAHEGTCGIGTAIAEARPTLVHKAEHFRVNNIGLSCSAAPIFDLEDRVVAVLDASALYSPHRRDSHAIVYGMVVESALAIENAYATQRLRDHWRVHLSRRADHRSTPRDWLLAFDAAGMVVGANRAARKALAARHPSHRGLRIDEVLDATADDLVAAARAHPSLACPVRLLASGERLYAVLESPQRIRAAAKDAPAESRQPADALAGLASGDPRTAANVALARKLADKSIPILLRGETGTGKEVFARAIHECSARRDQPFVAMNCAAIPETLIESELFGYREGAFTGARAQGARGKLVQASGGTLFLDEIGDMPLAMQSRLLRVLAEREVVPLGAEMPVALDLHVICASHRDLRAMVDAGLFREDLYYRVNGAAIELPPLRERADIGTLIRRILAEEARAIGRGEVELTSQAMQQLRQYAWPGNIRQLRHALRYACAVGDEPRLTLESLPAEIAAAAAGTTGANGANGGTDDDANATRRRLAEALMLAGGRVDAAAARIGMPRSTFYRKMRALGLSQLPR